MATQETKATSTIVAKGLADYKKAIQVGISLAWNAGGQSFCGHVGIQNTFFLAEVMRHLPNVEDVYFVYWNQNPDDMTEDVKKVLNLMGCLGYTVRHIDTCLDTMDILIEGTLGLTPEVANAVHERGHKIVHYGMSNVFIKQQEKFCYNVGEGIYHPGKCYDGIWFLPQYYNTNHCYFETVFGIRVQEAPYIWNTFFVDNTMFDYQHIAGYRGYWYDPSIRKGQDGRWNITVFEPNTSLLNHVYIPLLITEYAYRKRPDLMSHVFLNNTFEKRNTHPFYSFISRTDLLKDGIVSVEGAYSTPYFLGTYTDAIVSYQWENGLTNTYFEWAYGNYPIVHNSPFLKEENVGFYYNQFDAYDGADALIEALDTYDEQFEEHKKRNAAFLQAHHPENPEVLKQYEALVMDVLENRNHITY